jgi:hypothetical protein
MLYSRTNFFEVADDDAFKQWLQLLPDIHVLMDGHKRYSIISTCPDQGTMPDMMRAAPGSEDMVFCPFQLLLSAHLAPDSVVVIYTTGTLAEDPDQPYGQATALRSNGQAIRVNLQDIGALCLQQFGHNLIPFESEDFSPRKQLTFDDL